jgi:histidine phosphotransferase ChpT
MSGTQGALRLIELASVRLCDTLIGSVASLGHALCAPQERGSVAAGAVECLTNRLRLQRTAWGASDHPIGLIELAALAESLPPSIVVDLSALPPDTVFAAASGRMVLNLLLLAADSLPVGGTVILAGEAGDLFVRIAGHEAAWPPGMALCLANEAEAQTALTDGRNVQMALTALLAHASGIRLSSLVPPFARAEPAILRLGR